MFSKVKWSKFRLFPKDDEDSDYFMIVNLSHGKAEPADKMKMSFILTFAPTVKRLFELSRTTGRPQEVELTEKRLNIELPGGTGALFKINDGNFPRNVTKRIRPQSRRERRAGHGRHGRKPEHRNPKQASRTECAK